MELEIIRLTNAERPYLHVCTECDVDNQLVTGIPVVDPAKNCERNVSAVKPTDCQTGTSEVRTSKRLTIKLTKDAYDRDATTQVGMSASERHVDHDGRLLQTSKIDSCLQKVVPLALRERTHHVGHYLLIAKTLVIDPCTIKGKRNSSGHT